MNKFIWIFMVFVGLIVLLAYGLTQDPSKVPSPLIGKPLPQFTAQRLLSSQQMTTHLMKAPAIINVWASWCIACVEEHQVLTDLNKTLNIPIYGINYKDTKDDAKQWLERYGNPYQAILIDSKGDIGIDLGVYAVPETFLIDGNRIIRYKHIGPLNPSIVKNEIQPLMDRL